MIHKKLFKDTCLAKYMIKLEKTGESICDILNIYLLHQKLIEINKEKRISKKKGQGCSVIVCICSL